MVLLIGGAGFGIFTLIAVNAKKTGKPLLLLRRCRKVRKAWERVCMCVCMRMYVCMHVCVALCVVRACVCMYVCVVEVYVRPYACVRETHAMPLGKESTCRKREQEEEEYV